MERKERSIVAQYRVSTNKFFKNKSTGQYSIPVPAGKIKRMLGVNTRKNISGLIIPVGTMIYFNKKPREPDHTISEAEQQEEFDADKGINFDVDIR